MSQTAGIMNLQQPRMQTGLAAAVTGACPPARSTLVRSSVLVALLAGAFAALVAWHEHVHRVAPLDLDGWGHLVTTMNATGPSLEILFSEPSLWKGPVVPFYFGLIYFLAPFPESILIANVIVFAIAAGLLNAGFRALGAGAVTSAAAIQMWTLFRPHHIVFGYYLAEPFISLLVAILYCLVAWTIQSRRVSAALIIGALSSLLLLARAPFLLAVAGLFWLLFHHLRGVRLQLFVMFTVGFAATFLPWTIRNAVRFGEFIPFTTEGGKILFQGVYIAGDDAIMGSYDPKAGGSIPGTLRLKPEFVALELGECGKSAIEQYRYWKTLAIDEVRRDPLGQVRLLVRKAIRFWVILPTHSWQPNWKTGLVALVCLPLALYGAWRNRHSLLVQLCVIWIAGLWVFHALVHSELRYNFPVLPMMFLLALIGAKAMALRKHKPSLTPSPHFA